MTCANFEELKWLVSRKKEIAEKVAERLPSDIYSKDLLADLIIAAVGGRELKLRKEKRKYYLNREELRFWFEERVSSNSVVLSENDYLIALAQGFRLAVLRAGVVVDFDRRRKRDFGQRWTDYTRGEIGEIGIKHFLRNRGKEVKLEKKVEATPEEFYARDIKSCVEQGEERSARINVSVKATKLRGRWLDLPEAQSMRSDAFILAKSGLRLDHLAGFLKDQSLLERLFNFAKKAGESGFENTEVKRVWNNVPFTTPVPVYICGFIWKKDLVRKDLEIKKGKKKDTIESGIVKIPLSNNSSEIEVAGIGEMSGEHWLASGGMLRWGEEDWKDLVEKL